MNGGITANQRLCIQRIETNTGIPFQGSTFRDASNYISRCLPISKAIVSRNAFDWGGQPERVEHDTYPADVISIFKEPENRTPIDIDIYELEPWLKDIM